MSRPLRVALMIARLALRSALGGGARTLVLLSAMSGVVLVAVLLLSFLRGLDATVEQGVKAMHGHVRVTGLYKAEPGPGRPDLLLPAGADALRARLAAMDGVHHLSERTIHRVELIGPAGSLVLDVEGVELAKEPELREVLSLVGDGAGAPLPEGALDVPRALLLFAGQAERLGVGVGDTLSLRTRTLDQRHTAGFFTVAGVLGDRGLLGERRAFVERASLNELIGARPGAASAWFLFLDDARAATTLADELAAAIADTPGLSLLPIAGESLDERRGWMATQPSLGTNVHVSFWPDELDALRWLLSVFTLLGNAALALLLVVLAIGITNLAFVAVQDRRAEIGTLRALGMGRMAVGLTVLVEISGLAVLATALGSALGLGAAALLSRARIGVGYEGLQTVLWADTLELEPAPAAALLVGVVLVALSALSSALPAIAAARLPPMESMERGQ